MAEWEVGEEVRETQEKVGGTPKVDKTKEKLKEKAKENGGRTEGRRDPLSPDGRRAASCWRWVLSSMGVR